MSIHLIWATSNRERMLFGDTAIKVSNFLSQYAESKGIVMKVNHVNPEHVHALIDLPTRIFHRGSVEAFERSFFPLDQSKPSASGQVFLGTRLWSLLGFAIQCNPSGRIYCCSEGASSKENLHGRI